jgi:hypothetical protein
MKASERTALLDALRARFDTHTSRHPGVRWSNVEARLTASAAALRALQAMEASGGEPDVIAVDTTSGVVTFADCAAESPAGRRSVCFDREARTTRKEAAPVSSAMEMAAEMGIALMTEDDYRGLQALGEFDLKTSSWVQTPAAVRSRGGALFCDRRYGQVFLYHNGAQSYYAARGFRGVLRV